MTLSEPDQDALRALLAVEPVPGRPVPEARTIRAVGQAGAVRLARCRRAPTCTATSCSSVEVTRRSRDRVSEVVNDLGTVPGRQLRRGSALPRATCTGTSTRVRPSGVTSTSPARTAWLIGFRNGAAAHRPVLLRPRRPGSFSDDRASLCSGPWARCCSGWPASARRPQLPANSHRDRATHPHLRGRRPEQPRDRRADHRGDEHGPQASREHLPQAGCREPHRRGRSAPGGATSRPSTSRNASTGTPDA